MVYLGEVGWILWREAEQRVYFAAVETGVENPTSRRR